MFKVYRQRHLFLLWQIIFWLSPQEIHHFQNISLICKLLEVLAIWELFYWSWNLTWKRHKWNERQLTKFSVFRWYLSDLVFFKLWSSTPLNYDNNNCMCICLLFSARSIVSNKCVQSYSKNRIWLSLSFIHEVLLLLSIILIIHSPWIV